MLQKVKLNSSIKTYKTFRTNTPKRCPFYYRGLECKSRNSRDTGVIGIFGLGAQNKAGQRLPEVCQENTLVIANTLFQHTREDSTHGHHKMANTEIRLIMFFAAKDGETLSSQQKQDLAPTVAQTISFLLQNSDLN